MALENYIEMRDSVNDPKYKIKRELEFDLENKFWDRFVPKYCRSDIVPEWPFCSNVFRTIFDQFLKPLSR